MSLGKSLDIIRRARSNRLGIGGLNRMTDDEVSLIYDYLHENYEYRDGELIAKKDIKHSKRKGMSLGGFFHQGTGGSPKIRAHIKSNGKQSRWPLSYFIWLYHNKEKPKYIHHLNLNPIDNRIENLVNTSLTQLQSMCREKRKGYKAKKNKDGTISYRVTLDYNYKKINIGSFKDENIAREIYCKARDILESGLDCPVLLRNKLILLFPDQPIQNRKINNKFGLTGVYQNHNKFGARIRFNKKTMTLGFYSTPEEAHAAYLKAKEEYREANT